jgi:outer membrane protein assembly factor BamE (lipoprotein component of BamABCDE complex)
LGGADDALIESANNLALLDPGSNHTNEIPTCIDAATRILAFVQPGMTPEQVRQKVGRPTEIDDLYGTDWSYGDSSSVTVNFSYENAAISMVQGYSAHGHASCQ